MPITRRQSKLFQKLLTEQQSSSSDNSIMTTNNDNNLEDIEDIINPIKKEEEELLTESIIKDEVVEDNVVLIDYFSQTFQQRFQQEYQAIKNFRLENPNAPVDTMGCSSLADPLTDDKTKRFQSLIALMLSSQTKDEITAKAVNKLKEANGCKVEEVNKLTEEEIQKLIYPVCFYKRKSTYIKKVCKILIEKYDGDIPRDVKSLQSLPGVGPKMAYLCMTSAWNETVGIGVDTHVHRISNRLKWVNPTTTPEKTRLELEKYVPKEEWNTINYVLVGFGQTVCKPVGPKCETCVVKDTCHYHKDLMSDKIEKKKSKKRTSLGKTKKEEELEEETVDIKEEEEEEIIEKKTKKSTTKKKKSTTTKNKRKSFP
ncbi:hypothetical protein ABK040_002338 [Willaertia magna]